MHPVNSTNLLGVGGNQGPGGGRLQQLLSFAHALRGGLYFMLRSPVSAWAQLPLWRCATLATVRCAPPPLLLRPRPAAPPSSVACLLLVRRSFDRVRRSPVLMVILIALAASFLACFSLQTYFANQYIDPLSGRARVLPMSVRARRFSGSGGTPRGRAASLGGASQGSRAAAIADERRRMSWHRTTPMSGAA